MRQRVLFDSSTLVSAALREGSVPDQALNRALNAYQLCISEELLAELNAVLARNRFTRYATLEARKSFVEMVRHHGRMYTISALDIAGIAPLCRDTSDQHILALSQVAKVRFTISSDQDLLVLNPWNGIPILTPAQFLAEPQ